MARLKEFYNQEVAPAMMKKFGYTNVMQIPKVAKIVINMGVSEAVGNPKALDAAVADLTMISGQKPIVTKAKKIDFRVQSSRRHVDWDQSNPAERADVSFHG